MNYRHGFHAGNFADVMKHLCLLLMMRALQAKEKPLAVLDTHAGHGCYDLASVQAQRSGEWRDGIGKLWEGGANPAVLADYLTQVRGLQPPSERAKLRWYPGSPWLLRQLCRPQDRLILCELLPEAVADLRALFRHDPRVSIHQRDGFAALTALLPFAERRGLILVDPPYEAEDEFERLLRSVEAGHHRFPTATFMLWYPITARNPIERFLRRVRNSTLRKVLQVQLLPGHVEQGLLGSGLLIINPPWQSEQAIATAMSALATRLNDTQASASVEWLVAEQR